VAKADTPSAQLKFALFRQRAHPSLVLR
jgi:hypothetical protein